MSFHNHHHTGIRLLERVLPLGFAVSLASAALASDPTASAAEHTASASEHTEPSHPAPLRSAQPLALMPRGVTSFGAAECGGWLYVLGGYFGEPHHYSAEGQSRSFARLSLADETTWEELPEIEGLQGMALVALRGALYRIGGSRILNVAGEETRMESVRTFARFDPNARVWEELAPLPEGRSSLDACAIGSTIYAVGGWRLDGDAASAQWHDTLLAFDAAAEEPCWREIPQPFARRALAVAAASDRLVVLGGMDPDGETPRQVDVFDPAASAWSRGPDFPGEPFAAAATGAGDAVYASGRDGLVWSFVPGDPDWQPLARLAFPRMFHRLVASTGGELYALGGISGMTRAGRTRHVESIALTERGGEAVDPWAVWTLPAPGAAKNRQAIFLRGDELFAFGGNRSVGQHDFEPEDFLVEGFRLHLPSLDWKQVANLPAPRQSMASVLAPDETRGIAVGGFGHDGEVARTQAEVFAYDFGADAWQAVAAALPEPRTQIGLFEREGTLWIFGGLDYDPRRAEEDHFRIPLAALSAPAVEREPRFAPAGVELPRPRRAFGSALLDGRMFLVGGMREGFEPVDACDVFDFERRAWDEIPAPRRTRIAPELVALDGRLYLVGGSTRKGAGTPLEPDPSIEVFDPTTSSWSVLVEELPFAPLHLRAFAYEGRLLLYTAHDEERQVVHLALLDVAAASRSDARVAAR